MILFAFGHPSFFEHHTPSLALASVAAALACGSVLFRMAGVLVGSPKSYDLYLEDLAFVVVPAHDCILCFGLLVLIADEGVLLVSGCLED